MARAIIGIPRETKANETRVALIPSDCLEIINNGFDVIVEANAGEYAGFGNEKYKSVGAKIVVDPATLYKKANIIVKVKEPQPTEIPLLAKHHTLFCFLHLGGNPQLTRELAGTGLTAYAFETVQKNGKTPLLTPMSQIAGYLSVSLSSSFLMSAYGGKGVLLGKNPFHQAAHVLILGAGAAGQSALDAAYRVGARLTVVDINPSLLVMLKKKYSRISILESSYENIMKILPQVDVLIGAVYVYGRRAPQIISRKMIQLLPKGSVAFDIAVDQGGCFETTRPCTYSKPVYMEEGVVHSAIANLPSAVPGSASIALSRKILPYVIQIAKENISPGLKKGLNIENQEIMLKL
ncbi:MAG: alanine dehydrogenase [Spirochaetia bacterium]|nr:alanine dehydrogenase [Spirochaetia bacterium]